MTWNPKIDLIEGDAHKNLLRKAYRYAWEHSQDPETQTGALIISPSLDEILAYGANHFPEGVEVKFPTKEELQDEEKLKAWKNWKYDHIIHAEPSAIYAAAKAGKATKNAVMYMPWIPCTPCAKSIIDAGIKTLIGHKAMIMMTPEHWWESTDYALGLLEDAGVKKFMYDGKIGGVKGLFREKLWEP